jgi:hypothetical protein
MRLALRNDLVLGNLAGGNSSLSFPRTLRDKRLYICGGTGTGSRVSMERGSFILTAAQAATLSIQRQSEYLSARRQGPRVPPPLR